MRIKETATEGEGGVENRSFKAAYRRKCFKANKAKGREREREDVLRRKEALYCNTNKKFVEFFFSLLLSVSCRGHIVPGFPIESCNGRSAECKRVSNIQRKIRCLKGESSNSIFFFVSNDCNIFVEVVNGEHV